MTKYRVSGPDGQVHVFEGPDGATPAQVMEAAQAQFKGPQAAPPAAAQPQQGNSSLASGIDIMGGAETALHSFSDMATFGQGDKLSAGLATVLEPALHAVGIRSEEPKGYSGNLADIRQRGRDLAGTHPVSAIAGDVGGLVAGGGLLKGAFKAAEAVPVVGDVARSLGRVLAPVKGQTVRNFGRATAGNALLSGGLSAAEGDPLDTVATSAAVGGLGGAAVGEVAGVGLRMFQGASKKAMLALSKALDVSPDDLGQMFTRFVRETGGKTPSMAELVSLKGEGTLQQMAGRNASIGEAASLAAQGRTPSLAQQMSEAIANGKPQTPKALIDVRNKNMDVSMEPLRGQPVAVSQEDLSLLNDNRVRKAIKESPTLQQKLAQANQELRDNPQGVATNMTVDDFDSLRQFMRAKVSNFANPMHTKHNPQAARELGNVMDSVSNIATREVPEYGVALERYRADSRYIAGFEHGYGGKPIAKATEGADSAMLDSAEGQTGYTHGNTLYAAKQRLKAIAPSTVQPQREFGAQEAGQLAAGAAVAPSPWAISHIMRSIPGMHMSEKVQQVVATQLFSRDPAVVMQGIKNLRRGKVLDSEIRALGNRIGGATALNIASALKGQ